MPRAYEELMGALGRAMFYRPERKRVRDLLSRDARPQLLVGNEEFPLFDISMNGVSLLSENGHHSWAVGDEHDLTLLLYEQQVYSGRARVARVEPGPRNSTRVGLGLRTGFLDLPEFLRQDDEERLERALHHGPEYWRHKIPEPFQEQVSRAAHFLQFYRQTLDRHESRYRAPGGGGQRAVTALAERALDALRGPWDDIQRAASRAAVECLEDRDVLIASKQLTETLVTPVMMPCPIVTRSYLKPLGYAGDYQVMLYYYADSLEGESVFAQVFHKFGCEHPMSAGVRTRRDYVVDLMRTEHDRVLAGDPADPSFRVTSLGCGPAREVSEYIREREEWPGRVTWTLIDQEDQALSIAYHECQREILSRGVDAALACLHLSFIQMLRDPSLVPVERKQHFIFSTGLIDYLRESTAQALVRALYERLEPRGLLTLGNALAPNDYFWTPEFIVDWTILYRTRDDMLRLAAKLPESAEVEVQVEPGGAYYFLLVRKH
jgi:extracellular factor (EF) 3-hydroxypalmitic acid methyl ester biosynthesis protein